MLTINFKNQIDIALSRRQPAAPRRIILANRTRRRTSCRPGWGERALKGGKKRGRNKMDHSIATLSRVISHSPRNQASFIEDPPLALFLSISLSARISKITLFAGKIRDETRRYSKDRVRYFTKAGVNGPCYTAQCLLDEILLFFYFDLSYLTAEIRLSLA